MNAICGQGYDTSFCYIMQTGPGWNLGKIKRTHTHIKGKKKTRGMGCSQRLGPSRTGRWRKSHPRSDHQDRMVEHLILGIINHCAWMTLGIMQGIFS